MGKVKDGKEKTKKKNPGGRPQKFPTIDLSKVEKMASFGLIDKQIAELLGISESTFYEYKKDHPEFTQALEDGKSDPDNNVKRALYQRAMGYSCPETRTAVIDGKIEQLEVDKNYPPDVTACIFWLKNRQPKEWRDKQEIQHGGEIKNGLTVKVVHVEPEGGGDESAG